MMKSIRKIFSGRICIPFFTPSIHLASLAILQRLAWKDDLPRRAGERYLIDQTVSYPNDRLRSHETYQIIITRLEK